jgi:hypothetical protein
MARPTDSSEIRREHVEASMRLTPIEALRYE